ncbi:MAG: pyridoxamine 5'-phosphate oxidase family protein [Gemmatimonadaceae bacterium]|nr:pyridoxamine 5'-phosphate oxidase family protein [Gemmatimonadaceae bacterium]
MTTSQKKLKELDELIDGIDTAMFTTRRHDGHLVSRPMATQKRVNEADLWFVTDADTHKLDELLMDPHVNCSYLNPKSREWVSVSGVARVSRDRKKIRELYKPDWKAWFGDEGGERDGGPGDPRLTLIFVDADSVVYMKNDKPRPVILWEVLKGMVTGAPPNIGEVRHIGGGELMD